MAYGLNSLISEVPDSAKRIKSGGPGNLLHVLISLIVPVIL